MKNLRFLIVFLCCYQLSSSSFSQTQIELKNPSFEQYGVNTNNRLEGWNTCIYGENSPPDIHTRGDLKWNNVTPPYAGSSYLGLVVRPDSTGENISQRLTQAILKDHYYSFRIHLAKPETYLSRVRIEGDNNVYDALSETTSSFAHAVKLQVWGFEDVCKAGALLAETDEIDHVDWQSYTINIKPTQDFYHLAFIPVFAQDRAYAGCVLLDECSPLYETDASYLYSYEEPNIDSLFLNYETNYNPQTDDYVIKGSFVSYYPSGNKKSNYWTYDFSNQGFYSKRFHENSSYRPRITEYRYDHGHTLTDKVVFYQYIHHTAYYKDSKIASIKRYENGTLNGKQKLFWPSGNVMMEFEMSTEKKYQKRDIDNSLIFRFKHRVKHIYMAKEDGMKLEKFKIPKDSELGDLCITQDKKLVMYNTRGGLMGSLQFSETSLNPNELLSILRR